MKLHTIESGLFKLDGGAMFGVVPKVLWNKLNPADNNNLCTWSMRCLLVEDGERKILIDTGMGDKQDAKFQSHFHPHGGYTLKNSLAEKGFSTEDITDVIITHLHFDHVGGAMYRDEDGHILPLFPNATYWSNESHYNWSIDPNPREKASFLQENYVPLMEQGVLKFIDVEEGVSFTDKISISFVDGHTKAMMIPYIQLDNGKTLVYGADLMPSHCHIRMPYVMSYDLFPLTTLKEKAALYERATDGNHIIYFEHDKDMIAGTVVRNEKGRVVFGEEVVI